MEIYKTKEESRKAYKDYIYKHVNGVRKAFELFGKQLCETAIAIRKPSSELSASELFHMMRSIIASHDRSKFGEEEFEAYAAKFYPCEEDMKDNTQIDINFDKAWEHHYTHNPHHPEYWPNNVKQMPNCYFVEMICDWIGVSIAYHSSVYEWWFKRDNGRKEKSGLLPEGDIQLIDLFIARNKDMLDFSHEDS